MAAIGFEHVTKIFRDGTCAVADLTLEVADGEFMVLVGPSGCGKTTALRMIAGLEEPTEGTIRIGSRTVNLIPPKGRDVAMVFQDYALYPHMSVYDNMAFALKLRKTSKDDINRRVREAADILHLDGLLGRRPRALSGGQRQRVAMGRAIVREPQAFLMDEPLSNLDAKLRIQMRAEISRIQRELGVTTIYVTHDQTEAMTMGDRVAVMRLGVLEQVGRPEDLYRRPANAFTAGFIGAPAMNMVEARLVETSGILSAEFSGHRLRVDERALVERRALRPFLGKTVIIGIRPEHFEDAAVATSAPVENRLTTVVDLRESLGSEVLLFFTVEGRSVRSQDTADPGREGPFDLTQDGEGIEHRTHFVARVSADSGARPGESVQLAVDTRALHFFDPETGLAIYGDS